MSKIVFYGIEFEPEVKKGTFFNVDIDYEGKAQAKCEENIQNYCNEKNISINSLGKGEKHIYFVYDIETCKNFVSQKSVDTSDFYGKLPNNYLIIDLKKHGKPSNARFIGTMYAFEFPNHNFDERYTFRMSK